ncbi:MAG: putative peptidoglycan binding domain, partial [Fibrobacterota bacterium]
EPTPTPASSSIAKTSMHHSTDHNGSIPGKIGETSLLDRSKARPPADFDMSIFAKPKESSGPAALAKSVYNTSEYLKKLREEDPWPEQMPKPETVLKIANCRFLDPAPIDLAKPVRVACDVTSLGVPPTDADYLDFKIWGIHREPEKDSQDKLGNVETAKLKPQMTQTVEVRIDLSRTLDTNHLAPGTEIFLLAEAFRADKGLSEKSKAIATVAGPTRTFRFRISGAAFDLGKAFVLPEALPAVKQIVQWSQQNPLRKMVVVGHSQPSESDASLGHSRAEAFAALLTNRWEKWLPWFAPEKPASARWAVREAQLILEALKLYKGQAGGAMDPETETAIKAFQKSASEKGAKLEVTGKIDSNTRKELLRAYFGLEGTTLPKAADPKVYGAQKLSDTAAIEVFFFEPRFAPEPKSDTLSSGDSAYAEWTKAIEESKEFETHALHVQVVGSDKRPTAGTKITLSGPMRSESVTDAAGWVSFKNLRKGSYRLESWDGDERLSETKVEVPVTTTEKGAP